ncbi:alpha-tectorin-like [Dendropsophus ebraccatus]|uniref:alpha-tectorin-like n=1 Tax=Dendropsophus ebraccatus TaxID=150705 RepID=UPI0038318FFF
MENCGCFHNGRYYSLGDSLVASDCLQQCTCQNGGSVECTHFNCSDAEYCGLQEGKQGCFDRRGTCTLSANGNLVSFDHLSGSVDPDNTFDLVSVCQESESWFRIVVIAQSCAAGDKFAISAVHLYFPEFSVALRPDGRAWLNGRAKELPFTSGVVKVESTDGGVLLTSGEELEFSMSALGDLSLSVHQKFLGSFCGACGNFNREKSDDLQTLRRTSLHSFSEFIISWRAQDFVKCDS